MKWTLYFHSNKFHISNRTADDREDLINLFFKRIKYNTLRKKHEVEKKISREIVSDKKKSFPMFVIHSSNCDICQTTKQNIKGSDVEFILSAHEAVKVSAV